MTKFFSMTKFLTGLTFALLNVIQKRNLFLKSVENIMGKGENSGHQHLLFFLKMFSEILLLGMV